MTNTLRYLLILFLPMLVTTACSDADFGGGSGKKGKISDAAAPAGDGNDGEDLGSNKEGEETDQDGSGNPNETDKDDECSRAIGTGGGDSNGNGVFADGSASASAGSGATAVSVSCGDLRLKTTEDGKCQLVIETETRIDPDHVVGTINGKQVKFGDDGVSGEILDPGSYTISLKTQKSNATGGASAFCSISVTIK